MHILLYTITMLLKPLSMKYLVLGHMSRSCINNSSVTCRPGYCIYQSV